MVWDPATKYRMLLEINNAIVNQTTRRRLFQALANKISQYIEYDRFSINLYSEHTRSLSYFAHADGINPKGISGEERPLEKGAIAQAVIRSRKPLIIRDLSSHSYWESVRIMMAAGLKATMAYPLTTRNRILGSLHVSFKRPPFNMDSLADFLNELSGQVALAVDNMLAHTELMAVNEQLQQQKCFLLEQAEDGLGAEDFFFASQSMCEVVRQARLFSETDASLLITGETGTGKDRIAHLIHHMSARRDALFVKVNCPALTPSLFESELFGHAKGAFTGAHTQRVGRLEMADGGTVFLDEIGELEPYLQAKLLHVLQDRVFERVGDSRPVEVDCRFIAATNRDLERSTRDKTFRSDLYYRLNSLSQHIPPLRERIEDIPLLVERLTAIQSERTHRVPPQYTRSSLEALCRYSWPGNVRELKNLVKRIVLMKPGEVITGRDIEALLRPFQSNPVQECLTLAESERRHIERTLARTHGVVGGAQGAAALLGVPRSTLQYRIKKYGIDPAGFGNPAARSGQTPGVT